MKSKTVIKLYKKFAKELIGEDVHITISDRFWYSYEEDCLGLTKFIRRDEAEDAVAEYFARLGINYHPLTVGFLHELGHLWSTREYVLDDEFYDQMREELAELQIIYTFEMLSYKEALKCYYETCAEKLANTFLLKISKEKPEVITKYDVILANICKERMC